MPDPTLIIADTISEAYSKLEGLFRDLPIMTEVFNLTVHVRNPAYSVPKSYPLSEAEVRTLAEKWQSRTLPPDGSLLYTHGQRIHEYGSRYNRTTDQFETVVQLLARAPRRRRAVISLLDPTIDTAQPHNVPIPSFYIAQFFTNDQTLHITVYLRAQEISQFWMVNAYEMLIMLDRLVARLREETGIRYQRGTITTHATFAYWDEEFTLLERPLLERNLDKLFQIIYAVFIHHRTSAAERLIEYLNDAVRGHSYVELTGFEKMHTVCRDLLDTMIRDETDTNRKDKRRKEIHYFMGQIDSIRGEYSKLRDYLADRDPESAKVLDNLQQQVSAVCTWLQSILPTH